MDSIRSELLSNLLDALDRLFDREATILEIYSLTFATAQALKGDTLEPLFRSTAESLSEIGERLLWSSLARDDALTATNSLRIALARGLPSPSM
jgi:hypothetical protein